HDLNEVGQHHARQVRSGDGDRLEAREREAHEREVARADLDLNLGVPQPAPGVVGGREANYVYRGAGDLGQAQAAGRLHGVVEVRRSQRRDLGGAPQRVHAPLAGVTLERVRVRAV